MSEAQISNKTVEDGPFQGPAVGIFDLSQIAMTEEQERHIQRTGCCPKPECQPHEGRATPMRILYDVAQCGWLHCKRCDTVWMVPPLFIEQSKQFWNFTPELVDPAVRHLAGSGSSHLDAPTHMDFQREYLGMPYQPTAEEQRLRERAEEYHKTCEDYDKRVCTGPVVNGAIRPANGMEYTAINRHARGVRERLFEHIAALGFTRAQWHRAISDVDFHKRTKR